MSNDLSSESIHTFTSFWTELDLFCRGDNLQRFETK